MKRLAPAVVLVLAIGALYPMQRWIDDRFPPELFNDETLYFYSGNTIKRMSLGLDGLVADIYWIRAVQYFGRKLLDADPNADIGSLRDIRMDLLAPLLDIVVTLDPQHMSAYRFGALFLPERDFSAGVALLERGIEANPAEWQLYQDLAFVYWQNGEHDKAAKYYDDGSKLPGAPWWMADLAGLMRIRGASRESARRVYMGYLEDDDPRISNQAISRLKQIRSLDEQDAINSLLRQYTEEIGSCPSSLRILEPYFKSMGLEIGSEHIPVDPDGFPYVLNTEKCRVELARESSILR